MCVEIFYSQQTGSGRLFGSWLVTAYVTACSDETLQQRHTATAAKRRCTFSHVVHLRQ